jgi:hypothetical protein
MNFGDAITALKQGQSIFRKGWNGFGMHVYLEDRHQMTIGAGLFKGQIRVTEPHLVLFTPAGTHQPGWVASQADILAEDWEVLK